MDSPMTHASPFTTSNTTQQFGNPVRPSSSALASTTISSSMVRIKIQMISLRVVKTVFYVFVLFSPNIMFFTFKLL